MYIFARPSFGPNLKRLRRLRSASGPSREEPRSTTTTTTTTTTTATAIPIYLYYYYICAILSTGNICTIYCTVLYYYYVPYYITAGKSHMM